MYKMLPFPRAVCIGVEAMFCIPFLHIKSEESGMCHAWPCLGHVCLCAR